MQHRRFAIATATVVALAAGMTGSAIAAVGKKVGQSPDEVRAYWTKERMANAKPRERARPGGGASRPSGGFTSGAVDINQPLARTNGKVFFSAGGGNWVCSGTAVEHSTAAVVWTAGHCVNDGNGDNDFATNWMFVPAYNTAFEGPSRTATYLATTSEWAAPGGDDFRYDVGAANLGVGDDTLRSDVGGTLRGISFTMFGNPIGQAITAYGYPAAGKFSGQTMRYCSSTVTKLDPWSTAPKPMAIPCDMTGGSSGGAWVGSSGQVVSVNSFGYQGEKNTMYGPQLGSDAQSVYNAAANSSNDRTP